MVFVCIVEYWLITKPEEFELNLNGDFMGSSAPIAVIAASQILKVKWRLMKLFLNLFRCFALSNLWLCGKKHWTWTNACWGARKWGRFTSTSETCKLHASRYNSNLACAELTFSMEINGNQYPVQRPPLPLLAHSLLHHRTRPHPPPSCFFPQTKQGIQMSKNRGPNHNVAIDLIKELIITFCTLIYSRYLSSNTIWAWK